MRQLLIILFLFPVLLYSQSEGGFGFRRFANTAAMTSTSVNNSDKSASRRAYVNSTGLYYVWDGSTWIAEIAIDTFTYSNDTLKLSLLRDGVPGKVVRIDGSNIIDTVYDYTALRAYTKNAPLVYVKKEGIRGIFQRVFYGLAIDDGGINISGNDEWVRYAEDTTQVNVRWFGAVGDSITDDNTALQAALAYCIQRPKTTLYFPAGKYRYTAELYAYKPVDINIRGDGMNQTYLLPTNVNGIYFRTDSTTTVVDSKYGFAEMRDFQISDLSMLRVGTNAYSTKLVGIYLRGGFNTKLENVRVEEFFATSGTGIGGIGIKLDNTIPADVDAVQHTTFDNVWVAQCDTGIVTRLHNTMIWHDVKVDQSKKFGVVLRNGVFWNKGMVQGSTNCGIFFDHTANPFVLQSIHLQDVHFEGNANTAPKYGTLYKPDNTNANSIHIDNCFLSSPGDSKLFNLRRIINSSIVNNKYTGNSTDTLSLTSFYNVKFGGDNYYTFTLITSDCYIDWISGNGSGLTQEWLGHTIGKGTPGDYALSVGGSAIVDDSVAIGTANPTAKLDVNGISRLRDVSGITPTSVIGRDASGYVGGVAIGTGLDLTGGTLSNTVTNTNIYNSDDSFTATRLASLDTTKTFAVGRWSSPPNSSEIAGSYYRHGLIIGANTGSGRRTAITGSAYSRLTGSYITADRASVQFNASQLVGTQTVSNSSVYGVNSTYNYVSDPLQLYQNTEYGQRNIVRGTPSSKLSYLYMYHGGDMVGSVPYDTSAVSMWVGLPQLTDTVGSAKTVFGNKAVSKTRGWGVQSLFHTTNVNFSEHPFNWIKVETGTVAADTLLDGILFYDKYRFPNARPSSTLADSSVIVWVGDGTSTVPVFAPYSSGGSGTNIYNSNGTTTENTRTLTIRPGGTLTFSATDSIGGKFPFRVVATGNEPELQLWKGNSDSSWIRQSDSDYEIGSSATLGVYSEDALYFIADSIVLQGVGLPGKLHNILGMTDGGTVKQIEGVSNGDVLKWNSTGGYWEPGAGNGIYGGDGTTGALITDVTIDSILRFANTSGDPSEFSVLLGDVGGTYFEMKIDTARLTFFDVSGSNGFYVGPDGVKIKTVSTDGFIISSEVGINATDVSGYDLTLTDIRTKEGGAMMCEGVSTGTPAFSFNTTANTWGNNQAVYEFKENGTRFHFIDGLGTWRADNGAILTSSTTPATGTSVYIGHGMRRSTSTAGFDFAFGESVTADPGLAVFPISGTAGDTDILLQSTNDAAQSNIRFRLYGDGSLEVGSGMDVTLLGQLAHASGNISTSGDAQASEIILRRQITGENETELFLDGSSAQAVLPGTNKVWTGTAKCTGVVQAVGNGATIVAGDVSALWQPFTIKKVGTTTTLMTPTLGTTLEGWTDANMGGAGFTISADDTTEALKITFTPPTLGGTTTVCNAVCTVQLNEVGF